MRVPERPDKPTYLSLSCMARFITIAPHTLTMHGRFLTFFVSAHLPHIVVLLSSFHMSPQILHERPPNHEGEVPRRKQRQRTQTKTSWASLSTWHRAAGRWPVASLHQDSPTTVIAPASPAGYREDGLRGQGPEGRGGVILPSEPVDPHARVHWRLQNLLGLL